MITFPGEQISAPSERTLMLYSGLFDLAPFIIYPGGADLNALSAKPRTDPSSLPRPFHLAQGSGTRPLLYIPEEQISTL